MRMESQLKGRLGRVTIDLGGVEGLVASSCRSGFGNAIVTLCRRAGRLRLVCASSEIYISLNLSLTERAFFRGEPTARSAASCSMVR